MNNYQIDWWVKIFLKLIYIIIMIEQLIIIWIKKKYLLIHWTGRYWISWAGLIHNATHRNSYRSLPDPSILAQWTFSWTSFSIDQFDYYLIIYFRV